MRRMPRDRAARAGRERQTVRAALRARHRQRARCGV